MIVYVHDRRSPWNHYRAFRRDQGVSDVKFVIVSPSMTIAQVAGAIVRAGGAKGSIWRLMLLAHGNSGYLQIGRGLTRATAPQLGVLRSSFTPGGEGIEIHGCGVASGTAIGDTPTIGLRGSGQSGGGGDRLVRALAFATGVTVKAAIDAQRVDYDGVFNGPYIAVGPRGSTTVNQGQSVSWIR